MDKRDTRSNARWHGLLAEDHKTRRMILHLDSLAIDEEDDDQRKEWMSVIPSTDNSARLDADRVAIPARFEVCHICEGSGSHVNPNIDRHGLDPSDPELDPEFWESYHSGTFDVTCHGCDGRRVVLVPDDGPGPLHELVVMVITELEERDQEAYEHYQEQYAEARAFGY